MVKVHLIGYGKWGAVIDNAINDLNVKHVEPKDADWIIISTPNDLHYEQVSYWLGLRSYINCKIEENEVYIIRVRWSFIRDGFRERTKRSRGSLGFQGD